MPRHIPEHNQVSLDEPLLIKILDDFSERLYHYFRATVCLVVHGGAVMVLHPSLRCRQSTRDVDYIHRSFESEWKKRGVHDAGDRLNRCIADTAAQFGLGLDWMNAHADVALPMAYDKHARLYDPIYAEAMQPNNIALNTIYSKRGLKLVGVSWSWAVALKLVRYRKEDPDDIAAILKLGTQLKGLQWTRTIMEGWLLGSCSPMGYANYGQEQIELTRQKMRDAVKRAQSLAWPTHSASTYSLASQSTAAVERPPTAPSELSSGHPTLRHRAKSFSQQRLSAPAVMSSSSMPLIAMPRPSMHAQPQMLVPHHTGSSTRTHATPVSMTHIPVVSMFHGGRLPPGFVPYAVMPSPPGHQHPQHYPTSYRIRT